MRLLTEEEMSKYGIDGISFAEILKHGNELKVNIDAILVEQDSKTRKETLKAVIKDLEMIMKEAPDLKSLEKMIAGYITEKRGEMPEEAK